MSGRPFIMDTVVRKRTDAFHGIGVEVRRFQGLIRLFHKKMAFVVVEVFAPWKSPFFAALQAPPYNATREEQQPGTELERRGQSANTSKRSFQTK